MVTVGGNVGDMQVDGPAFRALATQVLEPLSDRLAAGEAVRLWVPGCGDGTWAFALVLALLGSGGSGLGGAQLRLFATDTSTRTIEAASRGEMGRGQVRQFLRAGHRRAFSWTGDRWQVRPAVRGRIVFSVHDALGDTPFTDIDLVFASGLLDGIPSACRSYMVQRCVQALKPGGHLAVEPYVRPDGIFPDLEPLVPEHGLYRVPHRRRRSTRREPPPDQPPPWRDASLLERVTEHFVACGLLVDETGDVRATVGTAPTVLLRPPPRVPWTLATSTTPALRSSLLNAFVRAVRSDHPATEPVGGVDARRIVATRLKASRLSAEPLWLVQLSTDETVADADANGVAFREHLVAMAETLTRAMDDAAARNLALRTANDALQASIDELEASNRRLAAINSELIAVRQENEHRIEELASLNLEVENLFRAADVALVVLDEQTRLRRYTPTAGRLFRFARTDIGRPFATLINDEVAALARAVEQVLAGAARHPLPVAFTDPAEGRTGYARVHPYRGDDGALRGAIVTIADVTELKSAEDALRRRNLALMRANEDLERFAYIASHDLKSPLRSVRTMLEILRTDLGDALTGENSDHLDLVADRVHQMERMIQDLLAYSRLGREKAIPETVAIGELVREQVDMLDVPEGFAVVIEADLPRFTIDRKLFEHVVRNLIGNAIGHHDRQVGQVRFSAVVGTAVPTFEVADDGPGIAARYHERIFEIFQKAGGRGDHQGSGMGLALVKKAVERNGGEIRVVSRDGERGATFRFSWPERSASAQASDQSD